MSCNDGVGVNASSYLKSSDAHFLDGLLGQHPARALEHHEGVGAVELLESNGAHEAGGLRSVRGPLILSRGRVRGEPAIISTNSGQSRLPHTQDSSGDSSKLWTRHGCVAPPEPAQTKWWNHLVVRIRRSWSDPSLPLLRPCIHCIGLDRMRNMEQLSSGTRRVLWSRHGQAAMPTHEEKYIVGLTTTAKVYSRGLPTKRHQGWERYALVKGRYSSSALTCSRQCP